MIEALRASPCLSSNCAVAPCRAPPPHLLAASIAPHAARRLNRAEASHQPSLGRALALHPRPISLPHRYPAATVRALAHSPARPSIRPLVRPSIHPLPFVLSLSPLFRVLRRFSRTAVFRLAFSFHPLGPRTGVRSVTRTRAFLFRRLPRATLPAPSRAMCAVCDALRSTSPVWVRALCALRAAVPSPARRGARGAARLGAPRRQVDDAMYVAQTVCNDGNRPTPLLSRIRISFHGQRRRPLRKRSR